MFLSPKTVIYLLYITKKPITPQSANRYIISSENKFNQKYCLKGINCILRHI